MHVPARFLAAFFVALGAAASTVHSTAGALQRTAPSGPRIEIAFSKEARAEAVTGMVYVAISRDNQRSPIEQASPTGVPLFSRFVEGLAPGTPAAITGDEI